MGWYVKKVEVSYSNYVAGDFYRGDFAVYKDYGKETEENVSNKTLTAGNYSAVISGIHNMDENNKTVILVNAFYSNKALEKIEVEKQSLLQGESISAPMVATLENIPAYEEGKELKAFVFDENMTPIYKNIVIGK